VYDEENMATVDKLCPMSGTVSPAEMRKKGKRVGELLLRIEQEASGRKMFKRP